MVHHLTVAILGIALLFYSLVWGHRRAAREKCEGLTDEATCVVGSSCHECARAAAMKDRQKNHRTCDSLYPGERAWPEQAT